MSSPSRLKVKRHTPLVLVPGAPWIATYGATSSWAGEKR